MSGSQYVIIGLQLALDNAPPTIRPQIEAAIRHIKRQEAIIAGLRVECAGARLYANEQYRRVRMALPDVQIDPYAAEDAQCPN